MKRNVPIKILGVGHYLPSRIVFNEEIEARCGLKPGWVQKRTGVCERRWVEDETSSWMAAQAAQEAVHHAGIQLDDIDLILNASGTQEQAIPDLSALTQRHLGLGESGIPCFGVNATCLSFVVALDMASHLLESGAYKNILIVSADVASCGINFDEPESAALLGDGGAAVVVSRTPDGEASQIHASHLVTYGKGAALTQIPGGGSSHHPNHPDTTPEDSLFHMNGLQVLKLTRKYGGDFLEKLQPELSSGLNDIQWIVPHQASKMGFELMYQYGWPPEKLIKTLDRYGNCVAASLPLTLYEGVMQGKIQRGDKILLVGTGAGLSIGGMILTY